MNKERAYSTMITIKRKPSDWLYLEEKILVLMAEHRTFAVNINPLSCGNSKAVIALQVPNEVTDDTRLTYTLKDETNGKVHPLQFKNTMLKELNKVDLWKAVCEAFGQPIQREKYISKRIRHKMEKRSQKRMEKEERIKESMKK